MLVQNPVRETWNEIRKKYEGYCIFIANCSDDGVRPKAGEVWAYGKTLAELNSLVDHFFDMEDTGMGIHSFITLTGFGDIGLMHVVPIND